MNLTHKIALDPTCRQLKYFSRAAGVHRFVYNWALAEWKRQHEAGKKPTANRLAVAFNAIYKAEFPWVGDVHRDCHSRPFIDIGAAFSGFFSKLSKHPKFKSRHKSRRSFYVANDKLRFVGRSVKLPAIGTIRMREPLRFTGKVMSARVVEDAGKWSICVSVEMPDEVRPRTGDQTVGVDLGIKTLATLSTGEQIENPRPLRKAQKRLRRAQRTMSRRKKGGENRDKQRKIVARIHRRVRSIRHDGLHKLTTRLCRENQTVVVEDLNVAGMVRNHCLAQAISDASFGIFRKILEYKAKMYGTAVIVAGRFYPSSKTCSGCGSVKDSLVLSQRTFECPCGLRIDRDLNAALNLRKLGLAKPEVTPTETGRPVAEVGTRRRRKVAT